MNVSELIVYSLPLGEWVPLTQVVRKFKENDPDFSASKYGFDKLLPLLQSRPKLVEIGEDKSVYPLVYKCKLVSESEIHQEEDNKIIPDSQNNPEKKSLFMIYKDQPKGEIFAHFGWDYKNDTETWETPFEILASKAKPESWNFNNEAFKKVKRNFPILQNYLNNTYKRIAQQNKIIYSKDKNRACFNTGLQTPTEKDIYATFYKNKIAHQLKQPDWTFYTFADSYSEKIEDFNPLPEVATYIEDSSDLVFDLSYELEVNVEHIVEKNQSRLPDIFKNDKRLAMTSIQGATKFLKEEIRRNYKVAIPHWHSNKIQLLLPLNLTSEDSEYSEDKADLALVADKDSSRNIYRITTALTMDMAYSNARLICRPDREWLNP